MQYDNDELELLDSIENGNLEKAPFANKDIKQMALDTQRYN